MKCYVKLTDFKNFRQICHQNAKLWDQMCVEVNPKNVVQKIEYVDDESYVDCDVVVEESHFVPKSSPSKAKKKRKVPQFQASSSELQSMDVVVFEGDEYSSSAIDTKLEQFYDFSCQICMPKQSFTSIYMFRSHMKTCHDVKHAKITCCNRKLGKRYELLDHLYLHLEPERLGCKICGKICADRKNLSAHIRRMHGSEDLKKWQCDICKKRFMNFDPLKAHLMSHLSNETRKKLKTHFCEECGQGFISENTLKSHIKYVHLKQGFVCDTCGRHFKARWDYELHRRNMHGEAGPSREQCTICFNWYSNDKALRDHIRYMHERTSDDKVTCEICGQELISKQTLRSHMKMKHEEKTHRCMYCGKALPSAFRLKEHEAMHTGISLYSCPYCPNKNFNMRSNMYKHFKAKHAFEWERDKADKNRNPEKWRVKEIPQESNDTTE